MLDKAIKIIKYTALYHASLAESEAAQEAGDTDTAVAAGEAAEYYYSHLLELDEE